MRWSERMQMKKRTGRTARQLYRRCLVDGALDEDRVRLVGRRLARSPRRGALPILGAFQRLVRLDIGRHTARVESATPLADPLRDTIRQRLSRRYGPRLRISFREDPALIGGVRIIVFSDVYDGTVRARLNTLRARF
jgi:F-type H+-transporting ATPase subunit delta